MRPALLSLFALVGVGAATWVVPTPVAAQVQDRILDVYGDDPCPSSNGQEIVVCKRHPRNDQFRIPQALRSSEPAPQALGGGALAAVQTTGGTGAQIQSCNAIGAGVNAGCLQKETDAWKAEKNAEKQAEGSIP
jgi:hypothetical protein